MKKLHTDTKTRKRSLKASRVLLIAAAVVMALSLGAFAGYYGLSMRDMQEEIWEDTKTLGMNGIAGMPEYEAGQEWSSYLQEMFEEGKNEPIVDETGNLLYDYGYGAYTQEAKDTLDAILEKYGLRAHENDSKSVRSIDELYEAAGAEGFMPELGDSSGYPVGGGYYDDGTVYSFKCAALLSNGINIRYEFYSYTKGIFTRTGGLIADADDYEEWSYTTAEGTEVLLAISDNKSILAVDLDNCFVFINIYSGTVNDGGHAEGAQTVDKSTLELFADSFDLAAINALAA